MYEKDASGKIMQITTKDTFKSVEGYTSGYSGPGPAFYNQQTFYVIIGIIGVLVLLGLFWHLYKNSKK